MAEATAGRIKVRKVKTAKKKRGLLASVFLWLFGILVVFPVCWVLVYRFVPPPMTSLMAIRYVEGRGMDYRWRGLQDISPTLAQAAIASEDAHFCAHHGFDFTAMEKAMAHNDRRPGRVRGGSTISQQTAKNVFLWPDRTYVRKGLEAYFTVLIEALWGKRRIMEVYLNVVEMGPGLYGAEAASQVDFGHPAKRMSTYRGHAPGRDDHCPNPLKYNAVQSRTSTSSAAPAASPARSGCGCAPTGHFRMYPMTRSLAALAVLLLATASAARAQSVPDVPINAQTAIFCRDITGAPVLQTYSNLGGVMRRWNERFNFDMSVEPN